MKKLILMFCLLFVLASCNESNNLINWDNESLIKETVIDENKITDDLVKEKDDKIEIKEEELPIKIGENYSNEQNSDIEFINKYYNLIEEWKLDEAYTMKVREWVYEDNYDPKIHFETFKNNYSFDDEVQINVSNLQNIWWFSYSFTVEIIYIDNNKEYYDVKMDRLPLDWMLGWLLKTISVNKR